MVKSNVRDDAGQRRDNVRRVQPSAKAGFPNNQIALLLRKKFQRHHGGEFKKRCVIFLVCGVQFFDQPDDFIFVNQLAVDLNPFTK